MKTSFPHRRFQLWEYRVSHGSLLIRSPKDADHSTNVDLIFGGVELILAPRVLGGVALEPGQDEDWQRVSEYISHPPGRIYALQSKQARYLVCASAHKVDIHSRDIFSSPFDLVP